MPASDNPSAPEQPGDCSINDATTGEQALVEVRKAKQREGWQAENHEAVIAYNEHVEVRACSVTACGAFDTPVLPCDHLLRFNRTAEYS